MAAPPDIDGLPPAELGSNGKAASLEVNALVAASLCADATRHLSIVLIVAAAGGAMAEDARFDRLDVLRANRKLAVPSIALA